MMESEQELKSQIVYWLTDILKNDDIGNNSFNQLVDNEYDNYVIKENAKKRIAELERQIQSLQEQLKNAIPKFKREQVVYSIRNINEIAPLTISDYSYNEKTKRLEYWNPFNVFIGTNEDTFATLEEAEKRLAELQGEGK